MPHTYSPSYATHDSAGIAAWNFNLKAEIGSYEDARAFLNFGDDSNTAPPFPAGSRDLGPKMKVVQRTEWIGIVLYNTEIIRYYPDDTFSVSNGGFATLTTRARLAAVLPHGFRPYHHSSKYIKGGLGLFGGNHAFPGRGRKQPEGILWPLNHDKRIDPATGQII